jgi:Ser/Thr protein kinase RdoA (MazF antagonist)
MASSRPPIFPIRGRGRWRACSRPRSWTGCGRWSNANAAGSSGGAWLAHGDFDATPIFQADGRYSGLIDFGEIRGTEPLFDLGHFLLHDREHLPIPLVADLLAGYGEIVVLPDGHQELVRRSAVLLGLRQLARWLGPFRALRPDHPAATNRAARLRQLLGGPD